jgi:hypothetical protein
VVRYLRRGLVLEIVSKTRKQETVEGETDYWYRISFDGLQGWVFGAYLEIFDSEERADNFSEDLE